MTIIDEIDGVLFDICMKPVGHKIIGLTATPSNDNSACELLVLERYTQVSSGLPMKKHVVKTVNTLAEFINETTDMAKLVYGNELMFM